MSNIIIRNTYNKNNREIFFWYLFKIKLTAFLTLSNFKKDINYFKLKSSIFRVFFIVVVNFIFIFQRYLLLEEL